jgi:hypothetical protein
MAITTRSSTSVNAVDLWGALFIEIRSPFQPREINPVANETQNQQRRYPIRADAARGDTEELRSSLNVDKCLTEAPGDIDSAQSA